MCSCIWETSTRTLYFAAIQKWLLLRCAKLQLNTVIRCIRHLKHVWNISNHFRSEKLQTFGLIHFYKEILDVTKTCTIAFKSGRNHWTHRLCLQTLEAGMADGFLPEKTLVLKAKMALCFTGSARSVSFRKRDVAKNPRRMVQISALEKILIKIIGNIKMAASLKWFIFFRI